MNHQQYLLCEALLSGMGWEKEFNGFTDSRQIIHWYEKLEDGRGPLLCVSASGERVVTARFMELAREQLEKLGQENGCNDVPALHTSPPTVIE